MFSLKSWVRRKWWLFRHEVYYHEILVPPSPTGNDTARLQVAIDVSAFEPEWFKEIALIYKRKWYRFLLKRPMLHSSVRLQAGTYFIDSPIMIGDTMSIQGPGAEHTIIEDQHKTDDIP